MKIFKINVLTILKMKSTNLVRYFLENESNLLHLNIVFVQLLFLYNFCFYDKKHEFERSANLMSA